MKSKEFKTAEQRLTKQDEYRELARDLIGDTSTWQDKKLGIQYQINTLMTTNGQTPFVTLFLYLKENDP